MINGQVVTLRVAQFFFYDNASPTGMRDRSKVKKTVPAQVPLGAIKPNRPDRANADKPTHEMILQEKLFF